VQQNLPWVLRFPRDPNELALNKRLTVCCLAVVCWVCTYRALQSDTTPAEQSPMRVLARALGFGRDENTSLSRWEDGKDAEIADMPDAFLANYARPAMVSIGEGVRALTTASYSNNTEVQMFQLLNNDRTAPAQAAEAGSNARPLKWDPELAALARAHSQELVDSGSLHHTGADGSQPSVRLSKAGFRWASMAENITMDRSVTQAEAAFMNEPKFRENHRANILNPAFTIVGVGIARRPDGTLYITQEFVQLR
jgi:uncharacterized protein YkwD